MEEYLVAIVQLAVQAITLLLIAYILLSWFVDPYHPARRFLGQLAEPILRPFRNLIPPVGMIDFSVMVALLAIQFAGQLVVLLIRTAFS